MMKKLNRRKESGAAAFELFSDSARIGVYTANDYVEIMQNLSVNGN
jgi:hypothetical protein